MVFRIAVIRELSVRVSFSLAHSSMTCLCSTLRRLGKTIGYLSRLLSTRMTVQFDGQATVSYLHSTYNTRISNDVRRLTK